MDTYEHYVYAYLRIDGSPYYIGKGKGLRAFAEHTTVNKPPTIDRIVFLEKNLSNLGACALERRYIEWYGRKINGSGILRNHTLGGEGNTGPRSEAWKTQHSAQMKGRKLSPERIARLKEVDRSYMQSSTWKSAHLHSVRNKKSTRTAYKCSGCGLIARKSSFKEGWHVKCKRDPHWHLTEVVQVLSKADRQLATT